MQFPTALTKFANTNAYKQSNHLTTDRTVTQWAITTHVLPAASIRIAPVSSNATARQRITTRVKTTIDHYASGERAQMAKESATRVIKRRKGHGWTNTKRRLRKTWPARAILDENPTQYLIEWEPVSRDVRCERQWEPKHHANTALVADWEERKEANLKSKSNSEQADTSSMQSAGEGHDYLATEVDNHWEQTIARSSSTAEHHTDLVNELQPSDDDRDMTQTPSHGKLGYCAPSHTPATATVTSSEASNMPLSSISGLTRMRNCPENTSIYRLPPTASYEAEQGCRPALLIDPHSGMLADPKLVCTARTDCSAHAPRAENSSKECSSPLEASTVHISEVASNAEAKDLGPTENPERVPGNKTTQECDVEETSPRAGTSIATLWSPAPSDLSDGQGDGSARYLKNKNHHASARAQAHVTVSPERVAACSDTPPGKLASARKQLRLLLRGSGRKRVRRSRSVLSPPP